MMIMRFSSTSDEQVVGIDDDEQVIISDDEDGEVIVVVEDDWKSLSAFAKSASNTSSFSSVKIDGRKPSIFGCLEAHPRSIKRKEASTEELEMYKALFQKAKEEEYNLGLKTMFFASSKSRGSLKIMLQEDGFLPSRGIRQEILSNVRPGGY